MGELTFFLILSGLVVIAIVAGFSYYIHHKKIRDEVQGFGHHANQIDDVLLQQHQEKRSSIAEEDLPDSFSTRRDEQIDLQVGDSQTAPKKKKTVIVDESVADDFPEEFHSQKEPAKQTKSGLASFFSKDSQNVEKEPTKESSTEAANVTKPKITSQTTQTKNTESQTQPQSQQPQGQVIKMAKEPLPEGVSDLIIAMAIKRVEGDISGEEILTACKACNIHYGEMNIFHCPADNNPSTYALFSIANMLEPGTFELDKMEQFSTTGLSLFMQLPLPMNCLDAYDIFLEKARLLAKFLNAELYDEKFNLVTSQAISHNKEKINKLHHDILKARKLETS